MMTQHAERDLKSSLENFIHVHQWVYIAAHSASLIRPSASTHRNIAIIQNVQLSFTVNFREAFAGLLNVTICVLT